MWRSKRVSPVVQHIRQRRRERRKAEQFSVAENMWRTEIDRLRARVAYEEHRKNRIGTHGKGCFFHGPSHYECALKEVERLTDRLALAEETAVYWMRAAIFKTDRDADKE